MLVVIANILVVLVGLYLAAGLGFALFFVRRGVDQIDPAARHGSWGFRLAILPGVTALWPLLLGRYRRREPPREERNAHRDLARERSSRGGLSVGTEPGEGSS